ncbi:MAG: 1,4-dihydroxy-2-naphthoate octaprenyltransferase [Bacteroidales bacterium]|jgi:1,4-dihydroxy-2-naphthoate octaprenyltransferase|nr:1,4-dihydroxy-2-naphthoate octaprenyltransferase [Bacteroidales bacterium]MDN5350140.1 1,4-dihydroxy-2-naphthoate polyprenyltransferase [Bacteroidales bacterium]
MASLNSWIKAARLRTLPLAMASITMGGFVASTHKTFNLKAVLMAGLTSLLLQILSNFANDYGDFSKGTDDKNRLGPKRTVQSGEVTAREMKLAMLTFSLLSLLSGLIMLFYYVQLPMTETLLFIALGIAAIVAAIKYTTGKNPYGYAGLGDFFVFIFFGLVGVLGTNFLATQAWKWSVLLPAIAMGMLSTGMLNLNNIRDYTNDKNKGKRTLAVKLGVEGAIIYHAALTSIPFLALLVYNLVTKAAWPAYVYLLLLPLFLIDLNKIRQLKNTAALDPYLKKLALKTLLLTLVYGIGIQL